MVTAGHLGLAEDLRTLHRPAAAGTSGTRCRTCVDPVGRPELWPCPTIRLVQRYVREVTRRG